jgi:hypothetical protein
MAVTVNYATSVTTAETPSSGVPAIDANQSIKQSQYNTALTLNAASTPNAKKSAKQVYTLASGVASIDLTSLTGLNGASLSMSGSKGRIIKIKAPSGNGAGITIAKGASNGYTGLGAAFSVTLPPGGEFAFYDGGNGVAVGGSAKILDVTGTGSTDTIQVEVVAGD